MELRLAVDIGGTFTDLAAYRTDTGEVIFTKSSTTPSELTDAIFTCIQKLSIPVDSVALFIHGSTIGINTIIERKGPSTGLLTTKGFRDNYEMGRRNRPDIYDLLFHRPRPLVARNHRYEASERLDASGSVLAPLLPLEVRATLEAIAETDISSLAVCLIHSYANPAHEQEVARLCEEIIPDIPVSLSSDISREYREYERASTTVMNAYLRPVVGGYLARLEHRLDSQGFGGRALIMQSSGGIMAIGAAARQPVRTIESGPAGGVAGSLWLCSNLGFRDAIAFDMGGTTAKACLIEDGEAKVTSDYYVGGRVLGHPAQVPFLDIIEIGAGAGSIAAVDAVGSLRVGPQSAGAVPGPACYGIGGVDATVTDANLVAGKLDPERFLGGEMPLDPALAKEAIAPLGRELGMDLTQTANGILRIANAMMAAAVSKITVERGHDPRDFVMVAYGGAGPMHATAVARELGIRTVVIPRAPAQFSALGMLMTDVRYDYVQTFLVSTSGITPTVLDERFSELESQARVQLSQDIGPVDVVFRRSSDMRYLGQFHTLTVPIPMGMFEEESLSRLDESFHEAHQKAYGHSAPGEPVEIISLRTAAFIRMQPPELPRIESGGSGSADQALLKYRRVVWEDGSETETPIFIRDRLLAGDSVQGPAIVQEAASVVPLGRGEIARADDYGHLHIDMTGDR